MRIELIRLFQWPAKDPKRTHGVYYIDGHFRCFTLEDIHRDVKIAAITRIPEGEYEIKLTMSGRFKRLMPEIVGVPGYSGIRQHGGTNEDHTEGCILQGWTASVAPDMPGLSSCKSAVEEIEKEIVEALKAGKQVKIKITNAEGHQ